MKTKIVVVVFLGLFAGLSSCATYKRCQNRFPPVAAKDSIYIETVKEIPILIPGDTVNIEVPVNCPDQDLVDIETSKLVQQIKILNGKLIANTKIKPDTVTVTVTEIKTVVKEVVVPEPVKYIPKIYSLSFWLWIGVIITVVGYTAFRLFTFKK